MIKYCIVWDRDTKVGYYGELENVLEYGRKLPGQFWTRKAPAKGFKHSPDMQIERANLKKRGYRLRKVTKHMAKKGGNK